MAKVNQPFKVTIFESERGWGQKVLSVEFYDSEEEAKKAAQKINNYGNFKEVPDYYIRAIVERC